MMEKWVTYGIVVAAWLSAAYWWWRAYRSWLGVAAPRRRRGEKNSDGT